MSGQIGELVCKSIGRMAEGYCFLPFQIIEFAIQNFASVLKEFAIANGNLSKVAQETITLQLHWVPAFLDSPLCSSMYFFKTNDL
jgi:hypothetical protein